MGGPFPINADYPQDSSPPLAWEYHWHWWEEAQRGCKETYWWKIS